VHSAVQVPGRDLLVVTDERYPPRVPVRAGAPWWTCRTRPRRRAVSVMDAPENDPRHVPRQARPARTRATNPTPVGGLALVSWYSSGLQVFDVSDAAHPQRLAELRPQASEPGAARDPQLGATVTMTWSYPIVRDGLIYVADIDEGLYVLRYNRTPAGGRGAGRVRRGQQQPDGGRRCPPRRAHRRRRPPRPPRRVGRSSTSPPRAASLPPVAIALIVLAVLVVGVGIAAVRALGGRLR